MKISKLISHQKYQLSRKTELSSRRISEKLITNMHDSIDN